MDEPEIEVRLTPTGMTAGTVAILATLGGLVTLSGPVLSFGVAALILFGLCRLLASRHLSRLEVSRVLQARARAGESFPIRTTFHPGKRFPGDMEVFFSDPASILMSDRRITLTNRQDSSLRYTGKSMTRGPLHPGKWTIHSNWPLGFFSVRRLGNFQDSNPLLLLPRPYLPGKLRRHLRRLSLESGRHTLEPPDPSSEFRLLREFRPGDPVRSIHWPGTLRTGRIQVSETDPPRPKPRAFGILIHSFEPPAKVLTPGTFEMILRIATGLLLRFRNEETPVVFRHLPENAVNLRNRTLFDAQLDRLAVVGRAPIRTLDFLLSTAADFADCDEVFVLSDCPQEEWEKPFQSLFPRCTCIDALSLKRGGAPELARRPVATK